MKHLERSLDNQNEWWKYLITFAVTLFGANIIGSIPLVVLIAIKSIQSGGQIAPNPSNFADLSVYGISPNLGLILFMIPFLISFLSLVLLLKPLHRRSLSEVINGTSRIRWNKILFAVAVWGSIMVVYILADYFINSDNYQLNFNFSSFISLVLISVILIPFQTTFEEVVFRGYLSQGIGALTKSRWFVLFIPALIFAMMHIMNPEVKEYGFWLSMPQYFIFGLVFGLVSLLDDGIETAIGAHLANNVFTSILITTQSSVLQTPALLSQQKVDPLKELLVLLVCGALFVAILSYKYKWNFNVMNKKVQLLPSASEMSLISDYSEKIINRTV